MRGSGLLVFGLAALTVAPVHAQDEVGFGVYFASDRAGAVIVTAVAPASPADLGGMQPGDRILAIAGTPLPPNNDGDRLGAVRDSLLSAGGTVRFEIVRRADTLGLAVGVGPYDGNALTRRHHRALCVRGDCWNGYGRWVHPNGRWYEGTFREGERLRGVLTEADGMVYAGAFELNVLMGPGLRRWPDGATWTGQWVFGTPQPPGVYTAPDGTSRPGLRD